MKNIISYNKLSEKIKNEIEVYHEKQVKNGFAHDLNNSTKEWFETSFESWLIENNQITINDNLRQFIRIDIEIPIKVADTLVEPCGDEILTTITNISRGGLYFISSHPFALSSIIKVEVGIGSVEDRLDDIEALAMVTRCVRIQDSEYGVGVVFSSIYCDQKETLNNFIFRHLAYYIQLEM